MAGVTVDLSGLSKIIKDARALKKEVMKPAFAFFRGITPRGSTGNARRSTSQDNAGDINANYNYASVLDGGRKSVNGKMQGSTQAPQGMTKPTMQEVTKLVNNYVRRIGGK